MYAIIQANYGILGTGDTKSDAIIDTKNWCNEQISSDIETVSASRLGNINDGELFATCDDSIINEYR
ncbi:hypothetical protein KAR91_72955 [Candidatus Pacearchaeota archaeon]|nr:hypothetical protein [Candidatus Pacearchaeota archaeon]